MIRSQRSQRSTAWLAVSLGGALALFALPALSVEEAIDPGGWDEGNLSLAADASGTLYAAWQDNRESGVYHVRFAYHPSGGGWTGSVRVDQTGDQDQLYPSIAVDGSGTAYLAWEDHRADTDAPEVRFAYRPAGGQWSASEIISVTTSSQMRPALAVNGMGTAVAAWIQGPYDDAFIFASRRPAGGQWSAAEQVTTGTGFARQSVHAALDDSGRAHVIWDEQSEYEWLMDVRYASQPVGGQWSAAEQVNDTTATTYLDLVCARLAVPADGGGPIHAIWMDKRAGIPNPDIYHAVRPLGGAWSANARVNDDAGSAVQWLPSLSLEGTGMATAVWVDRRNGGWDLYQAVRPAEGNWGVNTLLVASPIAGTQMPPHKDPASYFGAIDRPTTVAGGQVAGYSKATTADPYLPHNVFVHMTTGQLARIEVTPSAANLSVGQQEQFSATGYDLYGNLVPITPQWSTSGGTITSGGLYTAPTTPGDFTVTASVEGSEVMGTASVHVTHGQLARIEVTPSTANLSVGQQQQFAATGFDLYDNPVPITPQWSTTGGSITQDGLYTATDVGDFVVSAKAQAATRDTIIGIAAVHVTPASVEQLPGVAGAFSLSPSYPNPCDGVAMIEFGVPEPCHVRLEVYDPAGREVATLVDQACAPGTYRAAFTAGRLPSGLYLWRIRMKDFVAVRRMVVSGSAGRGH